MATSELSTGKTIFVLTVVAGCFAVLWPKIFYPMFFGSPQYVSNLEKAQGAASGCCDVIFEKDIQTLKIITQLCEENVLINTITNESKPLSKQAMLNLCYKQLYETCNIDLSNLFKMSQRHELDSSFKQFINIVRTFNSSLCLKYHYHVNFNLIGTPRIIKSNVMKPTSLINAKNEKPQLQPQMRQERPPHMRPEMLHPALRENGRVIPHEHIVPRVEPDLPPRPVVKHPGSPKPGMGRPSFGGTGPHQAAKQGGGIMNLLMPMYTISIVAFFIYTMLRFISNSSNNGPGTPSHDFYSGSTAEFRSSYYGEELCSAGGGGGRKQLEDGKTAGAGSEKTGPRLVVSAISGLLEQVNREILDSNPGLVSDPPQDGVQSDNVTKPEAQVAPQVAPQVNTSSLDSRQNSILEVEVNDYGDVQEVLDRQKALEEAKRQKKLQEEREKELEVALKMEEERRVEEQRLKEVERVKEEERKRLEEEERKRIEEQKRIEEEERQRKELERLADEQEQKIREELKRIEEEERQKELQRQKELEELKRIEEEERQRKALERLAQEQEQKRREEERQKELERQKEEERRIEAEQEVERLNELREQRRMEEDRKKQVLEDAKEEERQLFAKIEQEKEEQTRSVEEEGKILGSKDKLGEELAKEIHEPIQLANKSQELAKSPEELIKENIEKISEELNKTIIEPLEHEISRKETIGAERKTELNGQSSEAIDGKEFAHEPGRQQTIDSEDTSDSSTLKESLESLGKTKSHEASRPAPIGDSRDPTEEIDASAVQVIGMERTESLVGGQKWSPPTTAFPAHSARPATPANLTEQSASGPVTSRPATPGNFTGEESSTPAEPHKIILDGVLPEASQILVADELTETETEDGESDNDSVILSSRVTLSLIPSGSNEDQVRKWMADQEERKK